MNLNQLIDTIKKARDAYYNGSPIMTDAAYDALEDTLRQLDPSNPLLGFVGSAPASGAFAKVTHEIPMGSLNKAQNIGDMESWLRSCASTTRKELHISDKLDGISVSLKYTRVPNKPRFELVQALSRGDGITGEDITRNVTLMKGALKFIPAPPTADSTVKTLYVRGEIIITHDDFASHFKDGKNPRNSASGAAKQQHDNSKCQHLTVMAYQFLTDGSPLTRTKIEEFNLLKSFGFNTPKTYPAMSLKDIEARYQDYVTTTRKALNYDIDGLVVEFDDNPYRESLGDLNGRPKGAIAFKFPHEEKQTTLRNIRWQVGNSGRVTPVAEFDPVELAGVMVKKASLAGVRQVEQLKLYKDCIILVSRRNDCIPHVEANISSGILDD
jgi:DNA ligase (NAD+)